MPESRRPVGVEDPGTASVSDGTGAARPPSPISTAAYQFRGLVERRIAIPDNPPIAPGCLVVPSYALKDRWTPTRPTRAEIDLAASWWRRFPNAMLVMCTGDNQRLGVSNASVMADYAVSVGVPRESIVEEGASLTTRGNLRNAQEIVRRLGLGETALVTIDLYTRRAVATARRLGWDDIRWLSVYAQGEPAHGWKRFQTRSRTSILVYEILASAVSRAVGWTAL